MGAKEVETTINTDGKQVTKKQSRLVREAVSTLAQMLLEFEQRRQTELEVEHYVANQSK